MDDPALQDRLARLAPRCQFFVDQRSESQMRPGWSSAAHVPLGTVQRTWLIRLSVRHGDPERDRIILSDKDLASGLSRAVTEAERRGWDHQ